MTITKSYKSCRGCDTNLTSNTPANQYQRLKLIQNTVRVPSSLYTMNLASLSAYSQPTADTYNVCWNQMSDRRIPSIQKATIPTGFNSSLNRRHTSVTSSRPGCQTPGGIGCDIKHNSYDRYLNRIKAKNPLRQGPIPANFGGPIKFNPAYPIYGGKTLKTNIISGCNCPINSTIISVYENPSYITPITYNTITSYSVGQYVYALQTGNKYYTKAVILEINSDGTYNIQFNNGTIETYVNINNLHFCGCNYTNTSQTCINENILV